MTKFVMHYVEFVAPYSLLGRRPRGSTGRVVKWSKMTFHADDVEAGKAEATRLWKRLSCDSKGQTTDRYEFRSLEQIMPIEWNPPEDSD